MLSEDRLLEYLGSVGADKVQHSETTLLAHLQGVHDLLLEWDERPALCRAGLFHSIYGTEFFHDAPVSTHGRDKVQGLIGQESENLVWLWHISQRSEYPLNLGKAAADLSLSSRIDGKSISITEQQWRDLVLLLVADAFEQMPRRHILSQLRNRRRLMPLFPLIPTSVGEQLSVYFATHLTTSAIVRSLPSHMLRLVRGWRKT